MTDISVIGLGAMGSALARAQLKAGRSVTVWNRSIEKAAPLEEAGAIAAATASEAIMASPLTITCLKSHPQTNEVLRNAANALPGKTIIELSTGVGVVGAGVFARGEQRARQRGEVVRGQLQEGSDEAQQLLRRRGAHRLGLEP